MSRRARVGLLAWLAVLAVFVGLALAATRRTLPDQSALPATLSIFAVFGIFGAVWMAYDALRFEERPLKFVVGALAVMFLFVWYYLDRVRWRDDSQRVPVAVRRRRHA